MIVLVYFNLSGMMLLLSVVMFIMFLKFLILKLSLFIELFLFSFNSMNFSLVLYFDYKTFMFMMTVLLISSMIIIYSFEYMSMDMFSLRFIYLLMLFVFSMLLMIMGQNLLMILLGWDGLGLISYCLVIYYNNWGAYNSGMITILTNRLGDIGLLLSIGVLSIIGDWSFMFLPEADSMILFFMIVLACFTKSAQIPFSSWLPMAMAAPTPISALVHSSTLVTAGVYLLIRMEKLILLNSIFTSLMVFLSLMTMWASGLVALFENDFKKIIALSTLSQLGLMMMSVFIGLKLMSFFHLIIHAMFKSLLFMCAGLILHTMLNNQDIRFMGIMGGNYLLTLMMFNCSTLALCGFPFMAGFYSKDLILDLSIYKGFNFFLLEGFYLSILITVLYSFRLIYYMMMNFMKFSSYYFCNDSKMMNFSMMIMFIMSIFGGSVFNWFLFNSLITVSLSMETKLVILFLIFFSMFIGIFLNYLNNSKFLMKFKVNFEFFKSMWMLNYFSMVYSKMFLFNSGMLNEIEEMWDKIIDDSGLGFLMLKLMVYEYVLNKNFVEILFLFILALLFIF
uniref:NADH-ubiquinone oxidoreductase chain 5 n=1 Tax=Ceratobaeus sp. MM-2013 TaxID=1429432 RepID=A0A067YFP5_9HYME|nr:NADH dehydrogenase subunit 5 [Ceratobaeus sp. MM-2013]